MRRGPLPLNVHAALEPLIAIVIIAAPWIFGFSSVDDAKAVCIAVGAVMLIAGLLTDWRVAIARVIPIEVHMATDLALGVILILAPFVLGFGGQGGPTRFMVIAGAFEVLAALGTRWDAREAEASAVDRRSRSTPAH